MPTTPPRLAVIDIFAGLPAEEQRLLESRLEPLQLTRGELLIRQGEEADALYLVVSGRFQVLRHDHTAPIAQIGAGSPIGEIAFFAGGRRTASVQAERDSLVLKLTREDFDQLAARAPGVWPAIVATLAQRLADTTSGAKAKRQDRPRTIFIGRAGQGPLAPVFVTKLRAVFEQRANTIVLDGSSWQRAPGGVAPLVSKQDTAWYNALESQYDYIFYIGDDELNDWSKKAIRQADLVLLAADAGAPAGDPNPIERFAASLLTPGNIRLILLHDRRRPLTGTGAWLESRPFVGMHHHVAIGDSADYERIYRFVSGSAVGLIACGGGAFCAAHIGLFEALSQTGLSFDALGGTSGGAAMAAALVLGTSPDEMERHTHDIFVARKAMRRWTLPYYSLLDHKEFDAALEHYFTSVDIEDLWLPYFAVATNLTSNSLVCIRRGPLWEAIRASTAVPALLPPVFTKSGEMLVDGCLLDNVPVAAMRALKAGPNVVIEFKVPQPSRFAVSRRQLPARLQLLWASLTRAGRRALPNAPSPQTVLMRALMLYRRELAAEIDADDILLEPTMPEGMSHLDWHRHTELRALALAYAQAEIERLKVAGHPLLT